MDDNRFKSSERCDSKNESDAGANFICEITPTFFAMVFIRMAGTSNIIVPAIPMILDQNSNLTNVKL